MRRVILALLMLASTDFASSAIVFRDNFEYTVDRTNSATCSLFTSSGGWDSVKSNNCPAGSGMGYLYTTNTITGYSGTFPGTNSNRVLGMEARPYTFQSQTDFYLQYGSEVSPIGKIPANHWFQFWIYVNNYGSEQSLISQGKFIYPTRTYYPATLSNSGYVYICGLRKTSGPTLYSAPCGGADNVGCDRGFLSTGWNPNGGLVSNHIDYEENSFGQNLSTEAPIMPNTWTLVKIHIDLSGTDPRAVPGQTVYEQWIRRKGSTQWTKTTEYIGGVTIVNGQPIAFTPAFNDGFRSIRMPTTVGATTSAKGDWYDWWWYLDDFVIATSEADLPVYNDGGSSSVLARPTNLRTVP